MPCNVNSVNFFNPGLEIAQSLFTWVNVNAVNTRIREATMFLELNKLSTWRHV